MPSSGESSQPRDRTQVSRIAGRFFTIWAMKNILSTFLQNICLLEEWMAQGISDGEVEAFTLVQIWPWSVMLENQHYLIGIKRVHFLIHFQWINIHSSLMP